MKIYRIFVCKKKNEAVEAKNILKDIKENLQISSLQGLKIYNRYDVCGITDDEYLQAKNTIFSEPQVDECYDESIETSDGEHIIAVEYLPGQYDQRADSCAQCIQILTEKDKPLVKNAKIYVLNGELSAEEINKIKGYLINPVESQEASLLKPQSLEMELTYPETVETLDGFIDMDESALSVFVSEKGLAMDLDDLAFCRDYFKNTEKRNPTITEIRMIDTYWSDHCRHTTFTTSLDNIKIDDAKIKKAFDDYMSSRAFVYDTKKKRVCFMDIATIATKHMKKKGMIRNLDESEEINACSIVEDVNICGEKHKYLIMFKNETHNHPTEIEPFGGAATCLGGAIRDPLSGRSYVYQAMRITGCGDPRVPIADTIEGKLPQAKIARTAAKGYSSYGNQIGLSTGYVKEIYDDGYVAKHMEIGAVVGAAPYENVVREVPADGDVVILLGGKTGRDGCGGATGSSKAHDDKSLTSCGAEVQKGNPPEERKIQRFFRNPDVTRMIKRCNDFGAGGVSVAIGELADGLKINLDAVPKKYEGLDGTELAISESQERMAVVVSSSDVDKFIKEANNENIEATVVARVTKETRLVMEWKGNVICNISREFLNTNGAVKNADIYVPMQNWEYSAEEPDLSDKEKFESILSDINICSQKGLVEQFDSTIGAGTVLMPYGGKYQDTPIQTMVAKVPVLNGETDTSTFMSYGYDPKLSKSNPFLGASYAVVDSVTKLVAAGGDFKKAYLTLQEYFEKPYNKPERWGKPFMALLGAYSAQMELGIAAIGGKDSMSGSFNELDVPPTLVSFAITVGDAKNAVSPEFKSADSKVVYLPCPKKDGLIDYEALKNNFEMVHNLVLAGKIRSAFAVSMGGICEAIVKMSFGNRIGFEFSNTNLDIYSAGYGSILLEVSKNEEITGEIVGYTNADKFIVYNNNKFEICDLLNKYNKPLEAIYPTKTNSNQDKVTDFSYGNKQIVFAKEKFAAPKVTIPVFPGTNCEYDTAYAFEKAGAKANVLVFKNATSSDIKESIDALAKAISESQIVMIPGGFSGGDEPDGSAKFIATAFRNPKVKNAVMEMLTSRDSLMLGICNGFQALIKLGLVPFGEIREMDSDCPTLTFNTIGRHVSTMVSTKICSIKSPWLSKNEVGDIHKIAVSHGEGRFVASDEMVKMLAENGQIATQYVDLSGAPTMDIAFNPNQSAYAIEGITSPDGRIFGKMGHSERYRNNVFKNIDLSKDQKIFESGVEYFK